MIRLAAWTAPVTLMLSLSLAAPAHAAAQPPQLGEGIRRPPGNLTAGQQDEVKRYIGYWLEKLRTGGDGSAEARSKLCDMIDANKASAGFASSFCKELFDPNALPTCFPESKPKDAIKDLLVRTNASILLYVAAGADGTDAGLALAIDNLDRTKITGDSGGVVRFWAARTIEKLTELTPAAGAAAVLTPAEETAALKALLAAIKGENDEEGLPVIDRCLVAIASLNLPEAGDELFKLLDERLAQQQAAFAANPRITLTAERDALLKFYSHHLIAMGVAKPGVPLVKRFSEVTWKTYDLAARVIDKCDVGKEKTFDLKKAPEPFQSEKDLPLIQLDDMLRWAVGPDGGLPAKPGAEPAPAPKMSEWLQDPSHKDAIQIRFDRTLKWETALKDRDVFPPPPAPTPAPAQAAPPPAAPADAPPASAQTPP